MHASAISLLIGAALTSQVAIAQSNSFTLSTLVNFTGANGALPASNLIQASDGNYYGTTLHGGSDGFGSVYQLTPAGLLNTVHSFTGADGRYPYGSLVEGADGNLYGTTTEGGAMEQGTLFRLSFDGALVTLHSFGGPDGSLPYANLVQATDGNFYGTTTGGGPNESGFGSLFRMTPEGVVTSIYSFTANNDGQFPYNNLLQASDGNLYGVTSTGGIDNDGAAFQSTLNGNFFFIDFAGPVNSISPYTGLNENADEQLVGTTSSGGATGHGEIFTLSQDGTLTDVYDFSATSGDGGIPYAGLLLATDGNYYGTGVGYFTDGGVFSLSPAGEFQQLAFNSETGQLPFSSLIQGSDGNFYGNTSAGGTGSDGVLFRLTAPDPLPAPVQLSFNSRTVAVGATAKLSWQVINAYSDTLQQCNAFVSGNVPGAGNWSGLQLGKLSGQYFTGSANINPTEPGQYTYALTCGGVESGQATLTVTGTAKIPTLLQLTASPLVLTQGATVSLTAVVATLKKGAGEKTPTGTVTFRYGAETIGQVAINSSGIATLTGNSTGVPSGNYILSASYSGDANYAASNSNAVPVNLRAITTSALSVSPSVIQPGTTATLTALVSQEFGQQTPTGVVTFYCGSLALGKSNLLDGQATLVQSTQGLAPGNYSVSAAYGGDPYNAPSTSAAVNVTVK